jgi:hypothetical protein
MRRLPLLLTVILSVLTLVVGSARATEPKPADGGGVISIFHDTAIHFSPDSSAKFAADGESPEDQGRVVSIARLLPETRARGRIEGHVTIHPVPQDERSMFDRWDRAGNIRLVGGTEPDVEVIRFMTSYGGTTEHVVDISELAPLLSGDRKFRAFIDTWMSPAWKVDFELRYIADSTYDAPSWVLPVYYTDSFNRKDTGNGATVRVTVPRDFARVALRYFSTGHCTDGRDEDEFVSKANVISIDGHVVARVHPWRNDCRQYRERNPYCSRWADGSWSSDYSRSGWCPGTEVLPMEFDLTDHLHAGSHEIGFVIENMRPEDDKGNFGYWRVSASLVGWVDPPELWKN